MRHLAPVLAGLTLIAGTAVASASPAGAQEGPPTKLLPLADRVITRPLEEAEKTASGLVIPDTAKEKPQQGSVVAVGQSRSSETRDDLAIGGDRVIYAKYGGTEISVDGEESLIPTARDVLAKVTK